MNVQALCAIHHRATLSCLHIHSTKCLNYWKAFPPSDIIIIIIYVPLGDINSPHMTPAKSTSVSAGSLQEADEACGGSH